MKFPYIKTIDDIYPYVKDKKEIKFSKQSNETIIGCYNFSDSKTFDSEYVLECRGIAFDDNGNIISRPMEKFFNIGEKYSETVEEVLNDKKLSTIYNKLDGSMIASSYYKGEVLFRSKKSFTSEVVKLSNQIISRDQFNFCKVLSKNNFTAIFELTHPSARIVVKYEFPKLTLLHVRNNFTGEYLNNDSFILNLIEKYNIEKVKQYSLEEINKIISNKNNIVNMEGFVFEYEDFQKKKFKLPWYLRYHHAITFLRERDIALLILNEEVDDIKSMLSEIDIKLSDIEKIETKIKNDIISISDEIEEIYNESYHLDRKFFAIKYNSHPYFGMLMAKYLGKEFEIKDWYIKHKLKELFSLEVLGSSISKEILDEQ